MSMMELTNATFWFSMIASCRVLARNFRLAKADLKTWTMFSLISYQNTYRPLKVSRSVLRVYVVFILETILDQSDDGIKSFEKNRSRNSTS